MIPLGPTNPLPYQSLAKLRLSELRKSDDSSEARRLGYQPHEEVTEAPGLSSILRQT